MIRAVDLADALEEERDAMARVRLRLAEHRRRGTPFELAWPLALREAYQDVRVALEATQGAWESAYCLTDDPARARMREFAVDSLD
jgi:hypothetical protein